MKMENVAKTVLMITTITLHVRFTFLYISQPTTTKRQREMTIRPCVSWRKKYGMENKTNLHLQQSKCVRLRYTK